MYRRRPSRTGSARRSPSCTRPMPGGAANLAREARGSSVRGRSASRAAEPADTPALHRCTSRGWGPDDVRAAAPGPGSVGSVARAAETTDRPALHRSTSRGWGPDDVRAAARRRIGRHQPCKCEPPSRGRTLESRSQRIYRTGGLPRLAASSTQQPHRRPGAREGQPGPGLPGAPRRQPSPPHSHTISGSPATSPLPPHARQSVAPGGRGGISAASRGWSRPA
jgi:hypothetical protein